MAVTSEARFLAQQRDTAIGFFKPEYLALVSQNRAELEQLVSKQPSAAIGIAQSKPSKKAFMPFAAAVLAPLPVELVTWLKVRRRSVPRARAG
jgi:hypothetical protein